MTIGVASAVVEEARHQEETESSRSWRRADRSREHQDQVAVRAAREPLLTRKPPGPVAGRRRHAFVGADIRAARLLGEKHRDGEVVAGVVDDAGDETRGQRRVVAFEAAGRGVHHPDRAAR